MEFVQLSGLRLDGRRGTEVRNIGCTLGAVGDCDGSARLEQGLTNVVAIVHGPKESSLVNQKDRGIIRCDVFQAAFSTTDRRKRRPGDKRSLAIARAVEDTFSRVVQTSLFPGTQIEVSLHIFQSDGGLLSACINATTVALLDAGVPMIDMITSCTVGYLDGTTILDLNHLEENAGGPELTLSIMPKSSNILSITMGSSSTRVNKVLLDELIENAKTGCRLINKILQNKAREQINATLKQMKN